MEKQIYVNPKDKTDFYVLYLDDDGIPEKVYNSTKGGIYPKGTSEDPLIMIQLINLKYDLDNQLLKRNYI